jgi:hypothetical protein
MVLDSLSEQPVQLTGRYAVRVILSGGDGCLDELRDSYAVDGGDEGE